MGKAAVDGEGLRGDVAGRVGQQEQDGPEGWDALGDDSAAKRVILTQLIDGVIIGGNGTIAGDSVGRVRIVWRDLTDPR